MLTALTEGQLPRRLKRPKRFIQLDWYDGVWAAIALMECVDLSDRWFFMERLAAEAAQTSFCEAYLCWSFGGAMDFQPQRYQTEWHEDGVDEDCRDRLTKIRDWVGPCVVQLGESYTSVLESAPSDATDDPTEMLKTHFQHYPLAP